jgi:glyoxylase-like metal-dependent hydrolase (beta-lactamase superfamily II)
MEDDDRFAETLMHRHGIPQDIVFALRAVTRGFRAWGAGAQVSRRLSEGDELGFANRTWRVHHRPGHSPSDTVFHDAERRLLVGGDHLIGHISSNPLVSRPLAGGESEDRPQSLVAYLESLGRTRSMDIELVLAGHGEPVEHHRELIDERFRLHDKRARKIHRMIAEEPRTAYEIAQTMWGNVAVTQAYLALSEVLGHVDLLLNDGRVVAETSDDGVVRFAPGAVSAAA